MITKHECCEKGLDEKVKKILEGIRYREEKLQDGYDVILIWFLISLPSTLISILAKSYINFLLSNLIWIMVFFFVYFFKPRRGLSKLRLTKE